MQEISSSQLNFIEGKKETAEKNPLDAASLATSTNDIIKRHEEKLKDLPVQFQAQLRDGIVQYFRTSVDRYDSDAERGLDASEFDKYKRDMLQKVSEIVKRYAESGGAIHEQEERKKDASLSVAQVDDLDIKGLNFHPENLEPKIEKGKLTGDTSGIKTELNEFNSGSQRLAEEGEEISRHIAEFKEKYAKFEEGKTGLSVFLRGFSMNDRESEEMKNLLENLKVVGGRKIQQLQRKKDEIEKYGTRLNETGDNLRNKVSGQRDGDLLAFDSSEQTAESKQLKNEKAYRELAQRKALMESRRDEMESSRTALHEKGEQTARTYDELQLQKKELEDAAITITTAADNIRETLKNGDLPETQRKELEEKLKELESHGARAQDTVINLERGGATLNEAVSATQNAEESVAASSREITGTLENIVSPSLVNLESSIRQIEIARKANGTAKEQTEARYMSLLETIDATDAAVADNVLENTLSNSMVTQHLDQELQFLNHVKIKEPNGWDSTVGLLASNIGHGAEKAFVWVSGKLDKLSAGLKEIPVIGLIGYPIDVASGVMAGAGELWNGIGTLIAHPVEGITGLGSLVAIWSPSTMSSAWSSLGKSLLAAETFSQGEYGKGAGKVLLNVLLTATGAGAGVKGLQAGGIAFKIARTAEMGVIRASAKAVATGTRVFGRELASGLVKLPGDIIGLPGQMAKGLVSLGKRGFSSVRGDLPKLMAETSLEHGRVFAKLEKSTIGGMKAVDLFAGKSADDLARLTPKELLEAGVTNSRTISEFMRFRDILRRSEGLQDRLAYLNISAITNEPTLARLSRTMGIQGTGLRGLIDRHIHSRSVIGTLITGGVLGANALRRIAQSLAKELRHMAEHPMSGFREAAERAHKSEGVLKDEHADHKKPPAKQKVAGMSHSDIPSRT